MTMCYNPILIYNGKHNISYMEVAVKISPKGFVDAPIQDFVDLINHHCSYTTLSSCSGRISLFDPNHHHHDQYEPSSSMSTTGDVAASPETTTPDDGEAAPTSSVTTNFGKGTTGGWRFVSHYPVEDYQQIWDCFETETSNTEDSADWDISSDTAPWLFQMEPMLLHVGAASLKHGQLLLRIALECGYRESGLVVTDSRVTVAIRSHSLSLSMPLSNNKSHPLYPQSPKFIKALVDQANQRLEQTWKHQYRLYQAVESTLFQWNPPTIIANVSMNSSPDNNEQTSKKNPCTSASPPSLSLWQSATVAIIRDDDYVKSRETRETHKDKNRDRNSSRSPEDVDIWAFGGYGIGPESSSSKKRRRGAQRSSTIYKLERRDNQWESEWHAITPCCPSVDSILSGDVTGDFSVVASLPDGQGMAACHLGDWVVLWGGRQSPTSPLGQTLYLWDYQKLQLLTANYLHGDTPPAPRWGHTMVKATVNGTDCLVIMGGCNDVQVFDDVYILHYYHSNDQEGSNKDDASAGQGRHTFSWEKVSSISLPTPRFHHSSVVVHNNMICMFGGLESVSTVIRPLSFKEEDPKDTNFLWSFCIYETSQHTERGGIRSTKVKAVDFNGNSYLSGATSKMLSLSTLFGASSAVCNQLAPSTSSVYPPLMLITGGVTSVEAGIGIQVTGDGDGEDGNDISPLHCVLIIPGYKNESANISILPVQIVAPADDGGPCDFGSLVHHNCLRVSSNEYICVGGGVSTFAFGNTFAK